MVSRESAVFATTHEARHDQLSRNTDHSGIAKFDSRADSDYVILRGRIVDCVACAPRIIELRFALAESMCCPPPTPPAGGGEGRG